MNIKNPISACKNGAYLSKPTRTPFLCMGVSPGVLQCSNLKSFRLETFFFASTVEKSQILEYRKVAILVQGTVTTLI